MKQCPDWRSQKNFIDLKKKSGQVVPFIGAGFSMPGLPSWRGILDKFKEKCKDFLNPDDHKKLASFSDSGNLEAYADLLVSQSKDVNATKALKSIFDIAVPPSLTARFQALHEAFPGLKLTTNFDCLLEDSAPKRLVPIHGNNTQNLELALNSNLEKGLLKIHGGLDSPTSIILTKEQYKNAYGATDGFDENAKLPQFIRRVFQNRSVLFIGCSLGKDRTMAVMQSLKAVQHFALMQYPGSQSSLVETNQRLGDFHILPIWFENFDEITEILAALAPVALTQKELKVYELCRGLQRGLNGISQRTVADNVGISQATVHSLFGGEVKDVEKLYLIAVYLYEVFQDHLKKGLLSDVKASQLSDLAKKLSERPELQSRLKPADFFAAPDAPIPSNAKNYVRRKEMDRLEHLIKDQPFAIMLQGDSRSGISTVMAAISNELKDVLTIVIDFKEFPSQASKKKKNEANFWAFLRDSIHDSLFSRPDIEKDTSQENPNSRGTFLSWLQTYYLPLKLVSLWQLENLHCLPKAQLNALSSFLLYLVSRRFRVPGYDQISFLISVNPLVTHFHDHVVHESDFLRQKCIKVDLPPFSSEQVAWLASAYDLTLKGKELESLEQPIFGGQPGIANKFLYLLHQSKATVQEDSHEGNQVFPDLEEEMLDELGVHATSLVDMLLGKKPSAFENEIKESDLDTIKAYLSGLLSAEPPKKHPNEHFVFQALGLSAFYQVDKEGCLEVKANLLAPLQNAIKKRIKPKTN